MYHEKFKLHERQRKYRQGSLRTISLDVTSKCNMRCSHCYADTFNNVEQFDLGIFKNTVDELYEMGVFHYVLQGGEPICDWDRLEAILSMIYPKETYINVISNGYDMTPEKISLLKTLNVDKITYSLDSGIEDEHDKNRRKGSYRRVMEAIDNTIRDGLLSAISIVVTRESLYSEGFKRAYEFAEKKGIRIDVQIAEPVGKWDAKRDILMRPADSEYIKKMQQESPVLKNGQRMVNRDIFTGENDHCPAGIEFMAITADGNVLSCNFLQYTLGNIKDRTFREMRGSLINNCWFQGKPNCLCGENDEFIDKFIMPYAMQKKPLDAYRVFDLT